MITFNTQPTSPKFSYSELIYSVSSSLVGPSIPVDDIKQQYSFVVDVYSGSTLLQRLRKQPNPVGVGVFDLSDIINNNLEYDIAAIGSTNSYPGVEAAKTISVRFGEEYLDGTPATLKIFNGSDVEGAPALAATDLRVFKGFEEYDTQALNAASNINGLISSSALTNGRIHRDDKLSISTVESGIVLHNKLTVPVSGDALSITVNGVAYNYEIYDDRPLLGDVRFAWFNRRGGIDWFTADQEGDASTSVDKSTYSSTNVDYGITTPTNKAGNTFRPRERVYAIDYSVSHNKNTSWLTEDQANALQGLFDSPVVYIQHGSDMRPVVITNSYEHYSNKRDQRLFQYNIEYRYTNDKRGY